MEDPRFLTTSLRSENINDRLELTQQALLEKPASYWLDVLEKHDVPCAPVLTRREMIRHPQTIANGIVEESDHPIAGRLRQTRPAPRFSGTPTELRHPAPRLGEQSRQILAELGFEDRHIDRLIAEKIVMHGDGV